ncbi:hypothetical protein BDZ91DRAFT_746834 [Kalaharituber pfeilii]|nr:hypothetical protein BDZ91DRAFT_746834 [Kalaharituber pfeilii]
MFKLFSQRAVKAVPRHFRPSASRRIHSMQLPYIGPPTYETIARRFSSSEVDPRAYFARKLQEEAKQRGKYIDIHDVGGVDPKDFDVLITDVNDESLRNEISQVVGIPYLAKATEADANEVLKAGHGLIYGRKLRTIFPAAVGHKGKAHWVFFILDTGAPLTYLSSQASELFGIVEDRPTTVTIAGYHHAIHRSPETSHFTEVNLLGADFASQYNVSPWYNYQSGRMKLYFGTDWEVTEKPKL